MFAYYRVSLGRCLDETRAIRQGLAFAIFAVQPNNSTLIANRHPTFFLSESVNRGMGMSLWQAVGDAMRFADLRGVVIELTRARSLK
jgi:hypothetical protein